MKFSVIIPCWNQEGLITRCLDSIPKREDTEIIVVNDGSTDRTLWAIEEYKKNEYPDLIVISYEDNKGVSYARNKGLEASKGDYVVFIDSDDYVYPDVFGKICDYYYNQADMIFYDMEDNYKNIYVSNRHNFNQRVGMFKFIRKSFIGNTRFPIGKHYGEDGDFYRALLAKKPTMFYTNKVMYHYNYPRQGSLSDIGRKEKTKRITIDVRTNKVI